MPPRRKNQISLPLNERIKDGRIFDVNRQGKGFIYLRCQTRFCSGTAKKYPDGGIVLTHKHSAVCYNDKNAQMIADFKEALKTTLQRHFWKLKDLYDTVAEMFPQEAKVLVPYHSVLSSLKRWRKQLFPPCPKSLEAMAEELIKPENQQLFEYDVGRLHSLRITDSDGKVHLLIYDPDLIKSEFLNLLRLFIDGTFQTTPKMRNVYQLLSILGVKYNHAIPFVHILMACKTEVAYTAVLTALKNLINHATVEVVMTDFEQALRNACKRVFSNALITGCNCHYDRALLKKIKTLHMTALVRDDADAKLFLKKIMALAYLPADMIGREYETLKNGLTAAMKTSFASFLNYYERQWLRVVKPTGFSVFGLSRRTNNVIESYNSVLAEKLGKHPSAWTFMAKLVKLTSNARDDLRSLSLSKRIKRHPRYSTIYKQRELIKAWKQLYAREISAAEFLTQAALLKGHIYERICNISDDPPGHEPQMEEAVIVDPVAEDPDYEHQIFEDLRFDDNEPNDADALPNSSNDSLRDEMDRDIDVPERALSEGNSDQLNLADGQHSENNDDSLRDEMDRDIDMPERAVSEDDSVELHLADGQHSENNGNFAAEQINRNVDGAERTPSLDRQPPVFNVAHFAEVIHDGEDIHDADVVVISSSSDDSDAEREIERSNEVREVVDATVNVSNNSARTNGENNGIGAAPAQEPKPKVSRSRSKNLRKKRRQRQKKEGGSAVLRTYGHKRRRTNRDPECAICKMSRAKLTFVPCGHFCCCKQCFKRMRELRMPDTCPKCRTPFTSTVETFA